MISLRKFNRSERQMVNDEQRVKKEYWRMAEGKCRPVVALDNHLNNIKQKAIELAEQIKLCEN